MLNVAISIDSPTDYGPDAVRVVASACEDVVGAQRCPAASAIAPGEVAAWYAVVHPNDRGLASVRIEFRDRTADGVLIEERSLRFAARDSLKSRLASVGSVIAALAAAREGALVDLSRPPPADARSSPPLRAPGADTVPAADTPADWSLDVASLVSPSLGRGPIRLGGLARAHLGLAEHSFVVLSGRYSEHASDLTYSWVNLAIGAGARLRERSAKVNAELTGEIVFEHTAIRTERGAAHDSTFQNGWGGRVAVGTVWAAWRHCAIVFEVDGSFVVPKIHVIIAGQDASDVPFATLGISLGLRFSP